MSEGAPSRLAGSSTAAHKKRKLAQRSKGKAVLGQICKDRVAAESLRRNHDGKCMACGVVITVNHSQ